MKYSIGDKILFRKKVGYILDIVSNNRYIVESAGWVWSLSDKEMTQPARFKRVLVSGRTKTRD